MRTAVKINKVVKELKEMGRKKALILLDELEGQNCDLDYSDTKEGIIYGKNMDVINLIEQIYIYHEI